MNDSSRDVSLPHISPCNCACILHPAEEQQPCGCPCPKHPEGVVSAPHSGSYLAAEGETWVTMAHYEELLAERDRLFEQNERQATNIDALYRQRRDAELACELTREENTRLLEQLEAARRERSELAQRARSYFIDYEDDCPHPVAMFLDDISVDPAAPNPASEPESS